MPACAVDEHTHAHDRQRRSDQHNPAWSPFFHHTSHNRDYGGRTQGLRNQKQSGLERRLSKHLLEVAGMQQTAAEKHAGEQESGRVGGGDLPILQ